MSVKSASSSTSMPKVNIVQTTNDFIRKKFHQKLIETLELISCQSPDEKNSLAFPNNIWILNELVVPISAHGLDVGFMKLKYGMPENDLTTYAPISKLILTSINEKLMSQEKDEETNMDVDDSHGYLNLINHLLNFYHFTSSTMSLKIGSYFSYSHCHLFSTCFIS